MTAEQYRAEWRVSSTYPVAAPTPSIVMDDLSTRRNTNEAAMSSARFVRNAAGLLDGSFRPKAAVRGAAIYRTRRVRDVLIDNFEKEF
jgi:hypothetical protein